MLKKVGGRICAIIAVLSMALPVFGQGGTFMAGADARVIPLPQGVALGGYFQRRVWPFLNSRYARYFAASEGKIDDTRVKSVVLRVGVKQLVFVSVDLVAIDPDLRRAILDRVKRLGVDPRDVVISATHTHSGPGGSSQSFLWQQFAFDIFMPEVFASIRDTVFSSIESSLNNLRSAELAIGQNEFPEFVYNRRREGVVDPTLTMIKVSSTRGNPIANLLIFPIHGTYLSHHNRKLSGDVPTAVEHALDDRISGVTMFFQGAGGDIGPAGVNGSEAELKDLGRRFADKVADFYQTLRPSTPKSLRLIKHNAKLGFPVINLKECLLASTDLDEFWLDLLPRQLPAPRNFFDPVDITAIEIDGHAFVTVPGEPITEIGRAIKNHGSKLGFKSVSPMGLTNGYIGYVLTAEEYRAGGYEACNSFYGASLGKRIVDHSRALLELLHKTVKKDFN